MYPHSTFCIWVDHFENDSCMIHSTTAAVINDADDTAFIYEKVLVVMVCIFITIIVIGVLDVGNQRNKFMLNLMSHKRILVNWLEYF